MGVPLAATTLRRTRPFQRIYRDSTPQPGDPGFPVIDNLPVVQPVSAQFVHERFGVATHPTFATSVYRESNQDAWLGAVTGMGVSWIRGAFLPGGNSSEATAQRCRELGIKWLMLIVPENNTDVTDQSVATTREKVQYIAANYPDVCMGIEGTNEPNHHRSGTVPVPANWATIAVNHQRAIWEEVKAAPSMAHVQVVGPSLHDTVAFNSYKAGFGELSGAQHWHQLVAGGIKQYQDWLGVHKYMGGSPPPQALQTRLNHIYAAFGQNYPVWITETGYHNALGTTSGHRPASEEASGYYGPRLIMEMVAQRKIAITRYELLDDVDNTNPKEVHESNFGMIRTPSLDSSTWTDKPEVAKVKAVMERLRDPGPAYTPPPVGVSVGVGSTDVHWVVTGRRDGSARIWLWRSAPVWDPFTRAPLPNGLKSFSTVVTDRYGPRDIEVGPDLVSLPLR